MTSPAIGAPLATAEEEVVVAAHPQQQTDVELDADTSTCHMPHAAGTTVWLHASSEVAGGTGFGC